MIFDMLGLVGSFVAGLVGSPSQYIYSIIIKCPGCPVTEFTGCPQQLTSSAVVTLQIRRVPSAVTPEEIRPYPTAPPRKANTNRKLGKALTLTDTHIKEGM